MHDWRQRSEGRRHGPALLASANRDPSLNTEPDSLLLNRSNRRTLSFGSGGHQCPGQKIALRIATEAIGIWLQHHSVSATQSYRWTYVPSLNARIPRFQEVAE